VTAPNPEQVAHAGGGEVLIQALVFLAATCVVVPALRKARLSAVMGFLLIGVAMGPHVLGRLAETWPWLGAFELESYESTQLLAELGVIFLLFVIGLEVSFERLWALRRYVFGLGFAQVALSTIAIAAAALAFGNSLPVAAVIGLAFALSSTALVLQLLRERRQIATSAGRVTFSVLLMQDLMVVPILFLVAALTPSGGDVFGPNQIGIALLTALLSLAVILIAGRLILRPLFRWVAAANSREIFIAAAILAALGMGAAADAAGLSMALGAFLGGLLLAETEFRHQIEADLDPFKDLLLGLFFVTVGMQIDIALFLNQPLLILIGVVGLFIVKTAIIAPLARAFGLSWQRAIETAFLLGGAGEFAFVVIAAARGGGAVPEAVADYMLVVTALSIFITPLVATLGTYIAHRLRSAPTPPPEAAEESGHVVIAGFGRVGQMLADLLSAQEIPHIAVEGEMSDVTTLRRQGRPVHYGDASSRQVLESVGGANAAAIVVTINDAEGAERIVREAKRAWPHIPVYARARDADHARRLHGLGAALASPDSVEAALQLGEALLEGVGVPDEIARRIIADRREAESAKAL
jgi:monovalent cation:proton antiporter-2 (CPA2) family protein